MVKKNRDIQAAYEAGSTRCTESLTQKVDSTLEVNDMLIGKYLFKKQDLLLPVATFYII